MNNSEWGDKIEDSQTVGKNRNENPKYFVGGKNYREEIAEEHKNQNNVNTCSMFRGV